jgi:hypothetical protein
MSEYESLYRNNKLKANDIDSNKLSSNSTISNTKTYPLQTILNLFRSGASKKRSLVFQQQ